MRSPRNPLRHVRLMKWSQSFFEREAFHIANSKILTSFRCILLIYLKRENSEHGRSKHHCLLLGLSTLKPMGKPLQGELGAFTFTTAFTSRYLFKSVVAKDMVAPS